MDQGCARGGSGWERTPVRHDKAVPGRVCKPAPTFLSRCIRGSSGYGHPAGMPDQYLAHPIVLGLEDFQAIAANLQAHRAVGNRLQRFGHQAIEGLGAIAGQVPAQALVQFADRGGAVDDVAAIRLGFDVRVVDILFAFELADDFFEDVFQGDNAQHFAVFIHHHAQATLLLVEVQQLQLQGRAFRDKVGFVASGEQRLFGQAGVRQQVLDLPGVEHRFYLVDVAVEHRQARTLRGAQLFNDFFDRVVQVDAVYFAAGHQDVIDGDVVQGVDPRHAGCAAFVGFGLRVIIVIGQRFVAFLDHAGLAREWAQQQQGDAIEQPGEGIEDFQRHAQQRVAKAKHRLRMANGEGAGQVVGQYQEDRAGDQPAQPGAVLRPGVDRQQGAEDHHGGTAQAVAQDQAVAWKTQTGGGFIALTCTRAQRQQVLLGSLDGGKQRGP
ncbi:hypothetical protein BHE74_00044329 [Ensete ventricosum]|nr:hypothetical protein BHE74_00044329 [Ensete ventricosum]